MAVNEITRENIVKQASLPQSSTVWFTWIARFLRFSQRRQNVQQHKRETQYWRRNV